MFTLHWTTPSVIAFAQLCHCIITLPFLWFISTSCHGHLYHEIHHTCIVCIAKGQSRTQCSHGWPREVTQATESCFKILTSKLQRWRPKGCSSASSCNQGSTSITCQSKLAVCVEGQKAIQCYSHFEIETACIWKGHWNYPVALQEKGRHASHIGW